MRSSKNTALLSPATVDLGLGADLRQQLADEEEERKKKLLRQAQAMQRGSSPLGPGTMSLYGQAGGLSI